MVTMSPVVMPTSSAVMYRPDSDWIARPNASSSAFDFAPSPDASTTPLPPPIGRPAIAFLKLMPRDRRSASVIASRSSA